MSRPPSRCTDCCVICTRVIIWRRLSLRTIHDSPPPALECWGCTRADWAPS